MEYSYDDANRIAMRDGQRFTYVDGRVATIGDGGEALHVTYDDRGRLAKVTSSGDTTAYRYCR